MKMKKIIALIAVTAAITAVAIILNSMMTAENK